MATIGLGTLTLRRFSSAFGNAELGGPTGTKRLSSALMISLWIFYIALSILQPHFSKNTEGTDQGPLTECQKKIARG